MGRVAAEAGSAAVFRSAITCEADGARDVLEHDPLDVLGDRERYVPVVPVEKDGEVRAWPSVRDGGIYEPDDTTLTEMDFHIRVATTSLRGGSTGGGGTGSKVPLA